MQEKHFTTEFYVDMICSLQKKRIAVGYTQAELSFLLGYQLEHISRIEAFDMEADIFLTDLNRLALIFDCDILELMPNSHVSQEKIEIVTDCYQDSNRRVYEIHKTNKGGQTELICKNIENGTEPAFQPKEREAITVKLQAFINKTIASDFLINGAEAWDIHVRSRDEIKQWYPPQLLQEILQTYLWVDWPKLEVRQEENRITYYKKQECAR